MEKSTSMLTLKEIKEVFPAIRDTRIQFYGLIYSIREDGTPIRFIDIQDGSCVELL